MLNISIGLVGFKQIELGMGVVKHFLKAFVSVEKLFSKSFCSYGTEVFAKLFSYNM